MHERRVDQRGGDFPTKNAVQPTYAGGANDCWIAKLTPDGSALVYSTYLGGTNDDLCSVSAGRNGDAYVGGETRSVDFPVVDAFQNALKGTSDGIVVRLNASGSIVYSTYLGGRGGDGTAPAVVGNDDVAYVGGSTNSEDFPVYRAVQSHLGGSPAPDSDAILTKFSPNGELLFSSYLGGSSGDYGGAVFPDSSGNMYVSGTTYSSDFPTRLAFQPTFGGGSDAFITKIADPPCPADVTSKVDVIRFPPVRFVFAFLHFQWIAIHNRTGASIAGPLSLVMENLQNAVFIGSPLKTRCFSPEPDPVMLAFVGHDHLLGPNESTLTTLWFLDANPNQLAYVPHVLSGIPVN